MELVRFDRSRYALDILTWNRPEGHILPSAMKSADGFEHRCTACTTWAQIDHSPLTESEEL